MNRARRHQLLRRAVERYVDGESDAATAASARAHLAGCGRCSEFAEWLLLTKAALRHAVARRPPDLALVRLERHASMLAGR